MYAGLVQPWAGGIGGRAGGGGGRASRVAYTNNAEYHPPMLQSTQQENWAYHPEHPSLGSFGVSKLKSSFVL